MSSRGFEGDARASGVARSRRCDLFFAHERLFEKSAPGIAVLRAPTRHAFVREGGDGISNDLLGFQNTI